MNRTQCERILTWLRSGQTLTAAGAMRKFGCYRLAARMYDLRNQGHAVRSKLVSRGDKRFSVYWLST